MRSAGKSVEAGGIREQALVDSNVLESIQGEGG